jgi:hypothetical protein
MEMHHGMHQCGPGLDVLFEPLYGAGHVTGHVFAVNLRWRPYVL